MAVSKGTFGWRLVVWAAATVATVALVRLTLPGLAEAGSLAGAGFQIPPQRGLALLTLDIAFCCSAALGALVYSFAAFVISRQLRDLLASAAFCALASSAAMQAIADLGGLTGTADDRLMTAGLAYASLAFCGAALSRVSWRPITGVGFGVQLACAGSVTATFPLLILPRAMDNMVSRALGYSDAANTAHLAGSLGAAAAVCLLVAAVYANYRRHLAGDRLAAVDCYFQISFASAALARALSTARFDAWWTCSRALFIESWFIYLGAVAVENAIAHKEWRDRIDEMEALDDISWSLVGAGNVQELSRLMANALREKFDARIAAVYLADDSGENLRVAAISGPDILLKSLGAAYKAVSTDRRPGFHSGHTARALTSGEVQIAEDVFVDVEFVPWRMIAGQDGCAVSLPLVHMGRAAGVLNLYFADRGLLTRQRLRLLKTIAAAATPAIQNAQAAQTRRIAAGEMDLAA